MERLSPRRHGEPTLSFTAKSSRVRRLKARHEIARILARRYLEVARYREQHWRAISSGTGRLAEK